MKTSLKYVLIFTIASILMSGCQASNAVKGGTIGGIAGGALGGVIAGKDNTATGIIIGAAIGGTAGALIGRKMDKQAEELRRDLDGATIERVGEGIKITFDSGLMFATDRSALNSASQTNLAELAATLQKYEDTNILIEGHTDSTGGDEYNQKLSERRAASVADYLLGAGISQSRLQQVGYGESQPVADNSTTAGRRENRRVEIAIFANDKMKRMAKRGEL
jgi:outer membrane protein OmpA-like peptidoglycan-associated protein